MQDSDTVILGFRWPEQNNTTLWSWLRQSSSTFPQHFEKPNRFQRPYVYRSDLKPWNKDYHKKFSWNFAEKTRKYLCNHQRNILKVTFRDQLDKTPQTSKSFEIPIPEGRYWASWLGAREHASNMPHAEYKNCKKSNKYKRIYEFWTMCWLRVQTEIQRFMGI